MEGPPEKKLCLHPISPQFCLICNKRFEKKDKTIKSPTVQGLQTICNVAKIRSDDASKRIAAFEQQILAGEIQVSYHKICRASYTSSSQIRSECLQNNNVETTATSTRRSISSESAAFDIRRDCFICGSCSERKEKLTLVQTGTGSSTRAKVIAATEKRNDGIVHNRMLLYTDLFAADGKYHRKCYGTYISERNIKAAQNKQNRSETTNFDHAFQALTQQLDQTVMSSKLEVTVLSKLRDQYVKELGSENYSSWKLKRRLKNYYGEGMVFIEHPGKSDLVCNSSLTVGVALQKALQLENDLSHDSSQQDCEPIAPDMNENQVLHMAATILHRSMREIKDNDFYISGLEINVDKCGSFVPHKLYDFMLWCTNDKAYENATMCTDDKQCKDNLKIISLCHSLISQAQQVRTPLTLTLALYVHHHFGSRKLIEQLHALGLSVSYNEVRQFLTSAAVDQHKDDAFVPRWLVHSEDPSMIDAAIDNFDQNENTLDGKVTTHAMAAVIYKRCPVVASNCQIPRFPAQSLSEFNINDDIMR